MNLDKFQMVMFYRSAIINLDIGTALECAIFVSSHVAVNTQTYSCIWNKMKLHALYQLTITEIEQSKILEFFLRFLFSLCQFTWFYREKNRNGPILRENGQFVLHHKKMVRESVVCGDVRNSGATVGPNIVQCLDS